MSALLSFWSFCSTPRYVDVVQVNLRTEVPSPDDKPHSYLSERMRTLSAAHSSSHYSNRYMSPEGQIHVSRTWESLFQTALLLPVQCLSSGVCRTAFSESARLQRVRDRDGHARRCASMFRDWAAQNSDRLLLCPYT